MCTADNGSFRTTPDPDIVTRETSSVTPHVVLNLEKMDVVSLFCEGEGWEVMERLFTSLLIGIWDYFIDAINNQQKAIPKQLKWM